MINTININRFMNSKKHTINILVDGGQYEGNVYTQGTHYTGFVSVNGHGIYFQEIMPQTVFINYLGNKPAENAFFDITQRDAYKKPLQECNFESVRKFPFDISMNYKGGDKISFYASEFKNGEIEVFAYQTQYTKPLSKCENIFVGSDTGHGRRMLYALNDNGNIQAAVMPWLLKLDSPLQSFIIESVKAWFVGGMDAIPDFQNELLLATQRSQQYYDEKNKERYEAEKQKRELRIAEEEKKESERINNLIKSVEVLETKISGEDLVTIAKWLNIELHPRTIGSIRKRINSVIIKAGGGFQYSFYRTKSGAGISQSVRITIGNIINVARKQNVIAV